MIQVIHSKSKKYWNSFVPHCKCKISNISKINTKKVVENKFPPPPSVMNEHFSSFHLSITIKGLSKKWHGTRSQDPERGNHADTASYSIA